MSTWAPGEELVLRITDSIPDLARLAAYTVCRVYAGARPYQFDITKSAQLLMFFPGLIISRRPSDTRENYYTYELDPLDPKYNISYFFGSVTYNNDPVEFERQLKKLCG